ncbi:MAG TPA: hypothetical protein PLI95_00860 [Polyangiaceae bacterium]|jgi:hypothetical protein|nr:hypothetical protein [Polyangiaceae bacterium]
MSDKNDDFIDDEFETEPDELDDEVDTQAGDVDTESAEESFSREYVEQLRKEAAQYRVKGKEAARQAAEEAAERAREEFARDIYTALGLGDDDEVDPDELIAEANRQAHEAAESLRNYKVKDALREAAREHSANEKLLFPFLRGSDALYDLDPDDEDFADQVSAAVESALEDNPELRLAPKAPRRSGGDMSGGNNEKKKKTPDSIEDLIKARREYREKRFGLRY